MKRRLFYFPSDPHIFPPTEYYILKDIMPPVQKEFSMSTESRLNKLFHSSPVVPYDCLSRFVIMSDCHRGVGNWGDNFLKNETIYNAALTHYYRRNFTYIELGDGDELWENRNMKDIMEIHEDTFRLLERFYCDKRLFMLCGNHDYAKLCQKDAPCLCEVHESLLLKNRVNGHSIFLVHGHQGDLLNDALWKFSRFLVRYFWRPLELFALNDPTSAAKNNTKKSAVEQRLSAWAASHSQMLIAGHTHRPMLPESKNSLYFNCGSCVHPHCITALEICEEKITLVKWSTKSSSDMGVYIGREVLAGPLRLPLP